MSDALGGRDGVPLRNRGVAELLAREAERAEGHLRRAYRRAAGRAFLWPVEVAALLAAGGSLESLPGIGPYLARVVRGFLEAGEAPPEPPPLRRGFLTVCDARRALSDDPSWAAGCLGDLQVHTSWSDGSASIAEMAEAVFSTGRRWVGITDHSDGQRIPTGIGPEGLEAQRVEIEALNAALGPRGLRVLRSMEVNLAPDGSVDVPAEALARLDVVLGAFHSALRVTEDQTERYLAALRNPSVHVLAHPRCRMRGSRAGLRADWRRVFAEAARLGKAVECDGDPWRQDLDVDLLRVAGEEGCLVSLGSDAHATGDVAALEIALGATRLAGVPRERILAFRPAEEVVAWAASLRGDAGGRVSRTSGARPTAGRRAAPSRPGSPPASRPSRGRGPRGTS
jgi:putative hydrolase